MLGCIYQLWDWLEAPPLFTAANMDAKKLHQLQQSQNVQKKLPLAYQTNIADYRTATHSPTVFQQQQQLSYHMSHVPSGSSNTAALTAQYQQSPTTTSSSGPLSPIDIQPQANKLLLKHQATSGSGGNTSSSAHSSPYHQPSTSSGYPTSSGGTAGNSEQLYQSPTERTYLAAAGRLQASHNPATTLQQQYQQLQQAKLQAQLQTQNEAIQHQHRTFALRQAMNPPVPQGHYHTSQSSSMVSSVPQQSVVQQQMASQQQQRAPPSSLTLSNQFQPASGPLKVNQQQQAQHSAIGPQGQQHFHHHPQQQVHRSQEQIYGQHQHQQLQMQLHHQQQLHQQQQHQQQHYHPLQQRSKSDLQTPSGGNDQSPVYIQQNHPGHVVNQACQTQISAVVKTTSQTTQNTKTPSSEDSSSASAKSPTHHPVDRKKSSGGSNSSNTQALKSPLTKRPPSSPVTISGWLYKQGSDGLKVWRKRWFVLAEYCLYYYKGPEEEKLLGSILLPSYKVSACLPEDKIYRKYAFKCEHQNMRTYWLAAENPESMVQWVRALSAATMMQASASGGESSEQPSVSSSSANQSGENSDSGIHTLQSQQSKLSSQGQVTPASDSGKNQATNGNSGAGGGVQPLYANAPPKPRRITDGGYSSPSPEHSIDNERRAHQQQQQQQHQHQHQFQPSATSRRSGIMSPTLQQMQQQQQQQQYAHTHSGQSRPQHHAIYDTRTGNVSSALRVQQPPTQQYQQQQQSVYNIDHLETQYQQQMSLMNEEHSKTSPGSYMDAQMEAQIMQLQQQRAAIGDDIYGERELYMQRLVQQRYPAQAPNYGTNNTERRTPDAYGRSKNRIFSDYEDIYNFTQPGNVGATNVMSAQEALIQEAASYRRPLSPPTYDGHKHVPSIPSLYATNHLEHSSTQNAIGSNSNLRARPAAAIIRPHSADFLEYEARNDIATTDALPTPATTSHLTHMVKPDPVRAPRPKSSLDINRTPDSFYYSEENYAEKMRKSALYLQHPQGQTTLAQPQQAGSYRTATGSTDFSAAPHNGLNTIGYENPYERAYKRNELMQDALINQTGHTSIPRMSRSQMIGAGSHVRSSSTHPHTPQSPTIQQSNLLTAGLTTQQIIQQNEQFLRSASARLPKRTGTFDDEPNSPPPPADASPPPVIGTNNSAPASHLDGERKREESMKRLLEWKQRMLQSPLTRKGAQAHSAALNSNNDNNNSKNNVTNASKLGSNPNILLSSTTVASGAHYPIKKTSNNASVNVGLQRSRSETHANSGHGTGYNSYSSDDEDTQAGGIKQKSPAGRSSLRASTKINARQHTNTVNNDVATTTIITTATTTTTTATINLKLKKTIAIVEPSMNPIVQTSNPGSAMNMDKTLTTQTQKILKPILKTKIINVKPVVQDQEDKTTDPTCLLTKPNTALSLPKTANAIDIITPPEEEDRKQSSSPSPCSSPATSASTYIPVYNTKTLSLSKMDTLSGENNDFTSEIVAENVDSPLSPNKPLEAEVEIPSSSDKEIKETFFNETEAINDADATPMLMNLKMFKEQEEERKKLLRDSSNAEDRKISEPANNVQESAEEEEDEDTACEYTDDDLDEALAVEADVEEETTLDSSQIDCDLPDSKECSQIYENDAIISTLEDSINLDESHYLPMTPKRTEFNISSNSKFPLIALSNVTNAEEEEENHYVEMTKLLQDDDSKSNYEIMCISSSQSPTTVSGAKPKQVKIQNEPLYMELPVVKLPSPTPPPKKEELRVIAAAKTSTLKKAKKSSETFKKKSKKSSQERSQSKRKDLPDILKPSQNKLASNSDSSDADDESSKQMDSKKMRSRSRFSLSDTFRPASYYLGASTPLADCAESSDSEIVSPPPIPNSPPPLEELKTEEIFSAENYDTVKRRNSGSTNNKFNLSYDTLTKIHASNSSLNIPKTEATLKSSRLSLPDQFCKIRSSGGQVKATNTHVLKHHERTLSDSNYGFQTDNSSNASSDFDLYNKLKQNSPSYIATPTRYQSNNSLIHKYVASTPGTGNSSETDSVELRQRQGSDTELERQRSRRPLSEESISEIESLSEKFEDVLGAADLDTYLNDLQNSDLYLYQNTKFDKVGNLLNETPCTTKQGSFSLGHLIKPPKIFRTKEDEHFYGNIHFVSSTDSLQKLVTDSKDNRRRELQSQETLLEDPSDILGASSLTPTRYMTPLHSRNSSNISEQSAPYYYSELSRSRELINTPTMTLNNQKDIHAAGSNIAHIHNPIQRATNINVDILTDKEQTIDSKNLYKMKTNVEKLSYSTGKNLKTGEPFQQASSSNQPFHIKQMESAQMKINNYQTKLGQAIPFQQQQQQEQQQQQQHLTVNSNTTSPMQLSQSIALSAAVVTQATDLMVAVDKNTKITNIQKASGDEVALQTNPATENTNRSNQASKLSVLGNPVSGELLWEEDTLWRESLRRVSQRHARSLDDLDRIIVAPPTIVAYEAADAQHLEGRNKSRLSRDVTYVNDNVSQQLRSSFKHRLSEPKTICDVAELPDEHDVYVQLTENPLTSEDVNPAELYEVLREETGSNISSNKSAEIDRETIRQWDSMSSGLMKNYTSISNVETNVLSNSMKTEMEQTGNDSCAANTGASISIRNVRNLPRSNLTVKPDATDAQLQHHQQHQQQQLQQPQQQYNNYDQMQKLTNTYYGTAHDTKYAKATTLTDRSARSIGGNSSSGGGSSGVGVGGGGGGDGKNGGGSGMALTNGIYASTSTPLHPSTDGLGMEEYFVSGVGGNGSNHNIYGMHNGYQSIAVTQQQQHLSHSLRRAGSRAEIDMLERETSTQIRNLEVSAGDLLSRTHEELVLLLIQLRRQNSNTARNIEQCCSDIHDVQNRLRGAEGLSRAESIQRLDYLKQHLLDLERQYEKSKPLVNLVDNMVKLGSLYRNDAQQQRTQQTNQRTEAAALDRLEFNHRIQERRMLQEEQKQWNRLSPNHTELQSKVHQLYQLDQLLQEESGTLQNLQRDKEDLERALGGLRARIQDTNGPPLALEAAKKQQHMLERELSRVHQLLADNSKKLEQTVAGNARLEQELLILRQKLQSTRGSQTALAISDTYASNTTAMLESELKRVQTLVGDMQRQRQELSSAVRQLTENSNRLYQEIGNKEQDGLRINETSSNNGSIKKRGNTGCWIETDLDSMISVNRTLSDSTMNLSQPLYVDTSTVGTGKLSDFSGSEDVINEATRRSHNSNNSHLYRYNDLSDNLETSGVDSDGFLDTNPFANLTNQEKQEIKTVRIVKRESERRHRDRNERTSLSSSIQNLDQVLEEEHYGHMNGVLGGGNVGLNSNDDCSQHQSIERSKSLPRAYNNEPTAIKSSKHHHHHQHRHKHNNSIYNDYSYGPGQNNQSYDKNSNYSHNRNGQQQALTNGHIVPPREHLNPLANAYFAKQLQEKQKQQQQQQQQHSQPYTNYARENFQSELRRKTESVQSLNKSLTDLTPFQSEAAKQILSEMSGSASEDTEKMVEKIPSQHKHRRAVPREKRRHYTAPNNVINVKGLETTQTENDMNRNNTNWRARDDLDMEVALRPRLNAPDVVRSALGRGEKISENTIDNLLLAPNKIVIPERYIPENTPELSPEEKKRRQEKVESIKKMLADAPISTANETTATLPPSKLNEEKKQREHLLQLNQILAQQVMQMSKIVAEKAMSKIGNEEQNGVKETDDGRKSVSPNEPLPIYQQRDNYFS